MAKTKTGICAVILSVTSFFFILTAFCSGYWLVNDGQIPDPKFLRIGKTQPPTDQSRSGNTLISRFMGGLFSQFRGLPPPLRQQIHRLLVGLWRRVLHNPRLPLAWILHSHPVLFHPVHDTSTGGGSPHVALLLLQPWSRQVHHSVDEQRAQPLDRRVVWVDCCHNIWGERR